MSNYPEEIKKAAEELIDKQQRHLYPGEGIGEEKKWLRIIAIKVSIETCDFSLKQYEGSAANNVSYSASIRIEQIKAYLEGLL